MWAFAELLEELDTTTSMHLKVAAMARYFAAAPPADASWAVYILSGRRLRRRVGTAQLRSWLAEAANLPGWLVAETLATVGDIAESIALLAAEPAAAAPAGDTTISLAEWLEERLPPLRELPEAERRARIIGWWKTLPYTQCYVLNRLLTGTPQIGVSETLLARALSEVTSVPQPEIARRLAESWEPSADFWHGLHAWTPGAPNPCNPYPFALASRLDGDPARLGAIDEWLAEWKWDGLRAQIVRRADQCCIWSRTGELITERFPELRAAALAIPECVLDGEIVAWQDGVRPFPELQRRVARKRPAPKILATVPVRFLAYDLLELGGVDLRGTALRERRARLESLVDGATEAIGLSPTIAAGSWSELAAQRSRSRPRGAEGLMLKELGACYGTGGESGAWRTWRVEPWTCVVVMLYAQPGHGGRSNLYSEYTFGVWNGAELIPIARAHAGLSNAEVMELDRWIRAHTRERFGPVCAVDATQVFELAFEGIAASARHKSGITLRLARIVRWRHDTPAREANSLEDIRGLLRAEAEGA